MKKYLKTFWQKANIWSLFIGVVLGFGFGVYMMNALIPNANELIRIYQLDKETTQFDRLK